MIDTVVFRIHDIKYHLRLAEYLDKSLQQTGKTIRQKIGEDDFNVMQKLTHKTYITYHDTGSLFEVGHFNHLKSSHYNIAYKIDYVRNCIEFNVSIPKYAYGTNIVQYLPNPINPKFNFEKLSNIDHTLKISYQNLRHFFRKFITSEFGDIKVNPSLTEIARIDLCYNQVFNSKQEALDYLKQVKRVKKKFSRDSSNYSRSWETSMMYKTDLFSFKIYHKGSEYKANDLKKHLELNRANNKLLFDTTYLSGFADNILRYEMTIRGGLISQIYMNKIFRKDCPIWQSAVGMYKEYKSKKQGDKYLSWRRSLEPKEKKELEYCKNFITRRKKFFMSPSVQDGTFERVTDEYYLNNWPNKKERFQPFAYFSEELFIELSRKFSSILKEFELELFQDKQSIIQKLELHNKRVKSERERLKKSGVELDEPLKNATRKISLSKISVALELLQKHNYSEIQELGVYSRQTWYNIRKDLDLLGVTEKSLLDLTVNADFTHKKYYTELIYNQRKFIGLDFV